MPQLIRTPDDVTPAWLTDVLRGSGALDQGEVTDFAQQIDQRRLSFNANLDLTYSNDSTGPRP